MSSPALPRRLLAELVGTGLLVAVVVGSGIAAQRLSPNQTGLQLLENSLTTVFGLGVLILLFGPVSGAHFNPVVSAADWLLGRRVGTGLSGRDVAAYITAQVVGGIAGAVLANAMFGLALLQTATTTRASAGLWLGEVVATAGLIAVIFVLARTGRASLSAVTVASWIGAAYWFTSSTSFANPAVTAGRMFSDSFAGIAPASAPGFVVAQMVGALLGVALVLALYPDVCRVAGNVVVFESYTALRRTAKIKTHLVPLTTHFATDRLTALAQAQGAIVTDVPEVLFVCVHNAGRSQMAAALLDHHAQGRVHVRSAGSAPASEINPAVRDAMAELGLDLSRQFPKPLTDDVVRAADVVITMGCGDACPVYPGKRYLSWELPDPAGKSLAEIRPIRDKIDAHVRHLLAELDPARTRPFQEAGSSSTVD